MIVTDVDAHVRARRHVAVDAARSGGRAGRGAGVRCGGVRGVVVMRGDIEARRFVAGRAHAVALGAQTAGVRIVAVAARHAGIRHLALLERAVGEDLVAHHAVGRVERRGQQLERHAVEQRGAVPERLRERLAAAVAERARGALGAARWALVTLRGAAGQPRPRGVRRSSKRTSRPFEGPASSPWSSRGGARRRRGSLRTRR